MAEDPNIIFSIILLILLLAIAIGVPVFLIIVLVKTIRKSKRRSNAKEQKNTKSKGYNPLKKGVFELTEEEEKQGIIGFSIAGITYSKNKNKVYSELALLEPGDEFTLEPEPKNEYDENAIKVLSNCGTKFGYVPRYMTYQFRNNDNRLIYHKCIVSGIQRGIYIDVFIKCYPFSALKE